MRCRIERAEAALARTIEHARRAADERVDAYATGMLAAAAFWGPLPVADGIDRCRRLLEEAAGNRYVEGSVLHILGALAAMEGRFDQASDLVDEGAEVAAALGRLRLAAIWSQFAATVESLAGRPEAAAERLARGYRALERMGETGARSNLAADLAHVLASSGRPDEARRYAEESRALAAREDVYAQVRWRAATARALTATGDGDGDRAVRLAREAVTLAEATDMLNLQADAPVDLAETAARTGRPRRRRSPPPAACPCTSARATRWPRPPPGPAWTCRQLRRRGRSATPVGREAACRTGDSGRTSMTCPACCSTPSPGPWRPTSTPSTPAGCSRWAAPSASSAG